MKKVSNISLLCSLMFVRNFLTTNILLLCSYMLSKNYPDYKYFDALQLLAVAPLLRNTMEEEPRKYL